uniref:GGDEF domain-containing protein n=1 Tax=Hydrogenovibrio crunogenus (strain DSM 25203 / XCL-2) TaxID=317025 RepID=Q31FA1_HYDCU
MNHQVIARKAIEHLTKHNIKPSPVTFSIWFLYYLGQNKALISRVKSLLSTGQEISDASYEKLYEVYVLKEHFRDTLGINRNTSQIINKANDLKAKIHEFVESIRGHKDTLGDMRESLTVAETREAVEIILSEAIMELKTVETDSVETTLWMQKNVKELESVQNEVIEIEQSMSRDFLTGLPDKNYFEKTLMEFLKESMSGVISKRHFIVFDITDLDYYNEAFSWLLGDSIIRLVVKIIQTETDESWEMMRLSEDELAVFPPPSFPIHKIPDYIERIRTIIHEKKVVVKNKKQEIKNISLSAVIVKVAVYDDVETVNGKIQKGLDLIKEGQSGKVIKIDE